jgi:hypothetical protein
VIHVNFYKKEEGRMSSSHDEQKERRAVLENDGKVREQDTFFSRAQANADESGGRFAKQNPVTVTGTESVPIFPRQSPSSPFASDPVPAEPALGYSVEDKPAVGELHELVGPVVDEGLARQLLVKRGRV